MNIAIIGTGNVGTALTKACVSAGYSVRVASRDPSHAETLASVSGAVALATPAEAVEGADLVILAVPYSTHAAVVDELGASVDGLTVIDICNAGNSDMSALATDTSAAEELQALLPRAHVVKAFNTIFASEMASPVVDGQSLDGLFAGDDDSAKQQVAELLSAIGYRPIDAGPLSMARVLEGMGLLNVRLNALNGWAWRTGWKLLGPTS